MNYFIVTYAIYLLVSISLTVWVAKVLFNNGRIFWSTFFTVTYAWPILLTGCYWWVFISSTLATSVWRSKKAD